MLFRKKNRLSKIPAFSLPKFGHRHIGEIQFPSELAKHTQVKYQQVFPVLKLSDWILPMTSTEQSAALAALLEFLEATGDDALELTPKKVAERGKVVADPERPNMLVVDIERHRSLPGSAYVKGLPMDAYETYTQRIAFDPATKTLTELSKTPVDRSIDLAAMAEYQFDLSRPVVTLKSETEETRIIATRDNTLNFESSSLEEALEAVEKHFSGMDYSTVLTGLGSTDEETRRYANQLNAEVARLAVDSIREQWDEAEEV